MKGLGKTGDPRENPPTSGTVRHDFYMRKPGSDRAGVRTRFSLVGGEQANRSTTAAPAAGEKAEFPGLRARLVDALANRKECCRNYVHTRLPVSLWLPRYTLGDLLRDSLAGLAVGFTAVPQSIAYAVVAKLPPQVEKRGSDKGDTDTHIKCPMAAVGMPLNWRAVFSSCCYGLYSAIVGPFLYILLGGSKDLTIGPTAVLSLMTATFVAGHGVQFAVLLAFLSGCIIFLMGFLSMGFLVEFISVPVTSGFTSAAAVTIACMQFKSLLGYGGNSDSFLEAWHNLTVRIQHSSLWDSVLGLATIVILLLARKLKDSDKALAASGVGRTRLVLGKVLWLLAIGRNAVVVMAGSGLALLLHAHNLQPFTLTGNITAGFPTVQPPLFSTTLDGKYMSFSDMVGALGTGLLVVPLIAVLESMSVAKVFAMGKQLDVTQEMLTLGLCNVVGSFVGSMPVTGSFARTAVNNTSGVRTPLSGLFTGQPAPSSPRGE
ncbi:hypothetical protein PR048_024433 [Dryococelus australis]|uniref:SLC26A/SulP transporter domain-containing protein n=1 Tax=Dryococelus australis TaxID=614101 RepID=A0ABQ9GNJ8_9NEOP|nr:hypothetical protein PR048_024433 [Dryococelus australis]